MDATLLKTLGAIAGIGGLSLGVLLLVFRDVIRRTLFQRLSRDQSYRLLRLIVVLAFTISVVGIGAWVYTSTKSGPPPPVVACEDRKTPDDMIACTERLNPSDGSDADLIVRALTAFVVSSEGSDDMTSVVTHFISSPRYSAIALRVVRELASKGTHQVQAAILLATTYMRLQVSDDSRKDIDQFLKGLFRQNPTLLTNARAEAKDEAKTYLDTLSA
jgi:hypothetical protein